LVIIPDKYIFMYHFTNIHTNILYNINILLIEFFNNLKFIVNLYNNYQNNINDNYYLIYQII